MATAAELIAMGAVPVEDSPPQQKKYTKEELIAMGAVPVDEEKPTELKSAALGAAQGASFGFADEIEAYAKELPFVGDPEKRKKLLEGIRKEYALAQDTNPLSYGGGQLTGGIATSFMPGVGVAKGASALGAMGRGAVSGGLYAAGETEKDLLSKDGAEDVFKGAATGGALGGVGAAVGKGLKKASDALTMKATGATFSEAKHFKPGTLDAIRENKLVPWLGTAEDVAEKTEKLLDKTGKNIGNKLRGLNKSGVTVTKEEVQNQLSKEAKRLALKQGDAAALAQAQKTSAGILELFGNKKEVPVTWIQKQKVSVAPKSNAWLDPDAAKGNKSVYSGLAKLIEKKAAGSNVLDDLKKEQKLYGELTPVFRAAANKALKNQQQVAAGLLDMGIGTTAAYSDLKEGNILSGVAKGIGAAAARHAIQPRAAGFLSRATYAGKDIPERLARPATQSIFDMYSAEEKKKR